MSIKQQTFIAVWRDSNIPGDYIDIDFERFSYKRVSTVERAVKRLIREYPTFYRQGTHVDIYATPDGYSPDTLVRTIMISAID